MNEQPLVTFALIAYNAEAFVREAAEGAFAQTYHPMQIILSDDCSEDRTFDIMRDCVAHCQSGYRVFLNCNDSNLGIGNHINRIMELAKGDYIIIAAGDDVSLPERTERVVDAFASTCRRPYAVFSDCVEINERGEVIRAASSRPPDGFSELAALCRHSFRGVTGATSAWHRSVFDFFGPMQEGIVFEDRVIAFRAALLGGIHHIPQPLVRYRRHGVNTVSMFHSTSNADMRRRLQCFEDVYVNNIRDLKTTSEQGRIDNAQVGRCYPIMQREVAKLRGYQKFFSGHWPSMLVGLATVLVHGGNPFPAIRQYRRSGGEND